MADESLIPLERAERSILILRGHRVILDSDLAALYGVETRRLNEQVRRNIDRFPDDFAFSLTEEEYSALRSQFAILKTGRGEQLALRWGDIDWNKGDIDRNKGEIAFRRSSTGGRVGPTKSGKERRVPMTEGSAKALRKVKHLRGDLVFCRFDGQPLTIWQLHARLWSACRRAGLRKIRWHDLRRSFASQLVTAGVPIRRQDWLRPQHDRDDHALLTLGAGEWVRAHSGSGQPGRRGKGVATRELGITKLCDFR
jgi:integrase